MVSPARRRLARLAFATAAAAAVLLLTVAGLRGVILLAVGAAGLVATLAGVWWFLTRRGVCRWLAAALALAGPVAVTVLYARSGLLWLVALCTALWWFAVVCGRAALRRSRAGPVEREVPPPNRPCLIMNPRSGGGKVDRFGLVAKGRAQGAHVVLLDQPGTADVAQIARRAVAAGADLLGAAGGDGTQATVAAVAAENGLPFLVIPAGTRNHFAMDLGLPRDDPSACLDALLDGVELRVDLGRVGDRFFVNNASFGAYAAVVRSPAYREGRAATTLDLLPDLLPGNRGSLLRLCADGTRASASPQAVLVSNNPYAATDLGSIGRRDRLDGGVLGVAVATVRGVRDAARLVRGRRSKVLSRFTATEVVIDADTDTIPVGIDGEAATMPTPVRCTTHPGVLRVRVPRRRGTRTAPPALRWSALWRLARPAR